MSAWLLPESVADVLPSEARQIEELRRAVLDRFRVYGYELVMPPLLEYTESLLGNADASLDLQTFKLLDQASGRMLGLRADTTPQVARIDAHILNRQGPARLCYCGPVLHTHARGLHNTREPLQCGAELYGCTGIQADLEVLGLAVDTLALSGLSDYRFAFSHAGLLKALAYGHNVAEPVLYRIHQALSDKDQPLLHSLLQDCPAAFAKAVQPVPGLYGVALGEDGVLNRARQELPCTEAVVAVLNELQALLEGLKDSVGQDTQAGLPALMMDLADLASFDYHSGLVFSAYTELSPNPILRGGRYDHVGKVYGRARAATGFSVDLRELVSLKPVRTVAKPAIRAPWKQEPALSRAIRQLREAGEVVVQSIPQCQAEEEEFVCDRELVPGAKGWIVQPLGGGQIGGGQESK
ncbi:MAG: ATP phosphoribosyltransferase regulatory subunit [Limnobacter sp.]|nr:ATP phosphoribosyltransferase regulatory subunit [Limnobacter sp.]